MSNAVRHLARLGFYCSHLASKSDARFLAIARKDKSDVFFVSFPTTQFDYFAQLSK
jgi:hypothetical protein